MPWMFNCEYFAGLGFFVNQGRNAFHDRGEDGGYL